MSIFRRHLIFNFPGDHMLFKLPNLPLKLCFFTFPFIEVSRLFTLFHWRHSSWPSGSIACWSLDTYVAISPSTGLIRRLSRVQAPPKTANFHPPSHACQQRENKQTIAIGYYRNTINPPPPPSPLHQLPHGEIYHVLFSHGQGNYR